MLQAKKSNTRRKAVTMQFADFAGSKDHPNCQVPGSKNFLTRQLD
jgi:hypothetical protein